MVLGRVGAWWAVAGWGSLPGCSQHPGGEGALRGGFVAGVGGVRFVRRDLDEVSGLGEGYGLLGEGVGDHRVDLVADVGMLVEVGGEGVGCLTEGALRAAGFAVTA